MFLKSEYTKARTVTSSTGLSRFCTLSDKGEPVLDLSKILREFRLMGEKLSNWKFLLILVLALVVSSAPFLYGVARLIEVVKQ